MCEYVWHFGYQISIDLRNMPGLGWSLRMSAGVASTAAWTKEAINFSLGGSSAVNKHKWPVLVGVQWIILVAWLILIGTFAMDDDNPHWIVPVELVTFQQVKLKQPNWLRKLQKNMSSYWRSLFGTGTGQLSWLPGTSSLVDTPICSRIPWPTSSSWRWSHQGMLTARGA